MGESRDSRSFWTYPLLSQEWVSYERQIWQIYSEGRRPCGTKAIKNLGETGAWANTGNAQIFGVPPIISGTDKPTNFKFGRYIPYSQGPSEQKPFKILGENGAWAYPGAANIFWVPPIISGTGKATNFKFCMHIVSIYRNKSPLQISGKVAGCVVRTLEETFQGTHVLGTSRSLLCDSSAVLSQAIDFCRV